MTWEQIEKELATRLLETEKGPYREMEEVFARWRGKVQKGYSIRFSEEEKPLYEKRIRREIEFFKELDLLGE